MFNWADTEKPTLFKVPFEIWMGFTGSVTVLSITVVALKTTFVKWEPIWLRIKTLSAGFLQKLGKRKGTAHEAPRGAARGLGEV